MPKSPIDAFSKLFFESQDALRKYVRRLVRSRTATEDIVQESFARTLEQKEHVRTPRAFLFSIARNLAFDLRRNTRPYQSNEPGDFDGADVVSGSDSPEAALLGTERSKVLNEAVARLPPQCRAVFVLRAFHGCSHKEIAKRLNISPKTVENHLARAVRDTHEYVRRRYR
jgi:RNA polymerase sigma-70 factor, ECF subfamily